jgi:methyl-accepting chemotaxis protein
MFEKDPRTFSPEYKNLSPEQKAMVKLEITLTNFFREFSNSIFRFERIVYPVVLVLSLLVLSGFYLIYNVTQDMNIMANRVDPQMETNLNNMSNNIAQLSANVSAMTKHMVVIAENMQTMDKNIASMNNNIAKLSGSVEHMRVNMESMTYTVSDMNEVMKAMNMNTGNMSRDIHRIQKPMKFFP